MLSNPDTNIKQVSPSFKKLKHANAKSILRNPKRYVKNNIFSFNLLFMLINGTINNPVTWTRSLEIVLDQWFLAQLNIRIMQGHTTRKNTKLVWGGARASAPFNSPGDSNMHPKLRTTALEASFSLNTFKDHNLLNLAPISLQ